jgi:nucleoid-associated protein YgaU
VQRPFILGLVLVGALLLSAALVLYLVRDRRDQATAPSAAAVAPPPAASADPAARAAPPPSFDMVRVNPRGDAVIAGRAEPGAEVTVLEGDRVIGRVTADSRGEWVLLPSEPLAGGHRELRLQATRPGALPVLSDQVVALDVPTATHGAGAAGAGPSAGGPTAVGAPVRGAAEHAVVEPGNSLWELARRRYGNGTEYPAIYRANRALIRDPDLIYPGQVFVMPAER